MKVFDGSEVADAVVRSDAFGSTLASQLPHLLLAQLLAAAAFAWNHGRPTRRARRQGVTTSASRHYAWSHATTLVRLSCALKLWSVKSNFFISSVAYPN